MAGREDQDPAGGPGDPGWQPRTRSERRAAERAAAEQATQPSSAGPADPPTTQPPRVTRPQAPHQSWFEGPPTARAPGPPPRSPQSPGPPQPGHQHPDDHHPDDAEPPEEHERRRLSPRFTVLLTLAALVLDAWAALCFVDTGEPALVALTALAPVLSVITLPVLAIAVARRSVVPALLSLAAAVVPWVLVAGSAVPGPGVTSAAGHEVLRVMTVDSSAGRADAASVVETARTYAADVVVVTGLTTGFVEALATAGLNETVPSRWSSIPGGRTLGVGLWSKIPIGAATPVPGFSQPATTTSLDTSSGMVSLVVAHAGGPAIVPDTNWRADLRALGAITVDGPRILAGDLGGTVWHPAFRRFAGTGWFEAADVLGQGLRPTWPAWSPVPFSPLDQVMVGGGVGVSRADTITIPGTTHRALLVTAVLPARAK